MDKLSLERLDDHDVSAGCENEILGSPINNSDKNVLPVISR